MIFRMVQRNMKRLMQYRFSTRGIVIAVLLGMLCLGVFSACKSGNNDVSQNQDAAGASAAYKKITAAEAMEMIESGDPCVLLDVRSEQEYLEVHIAGATLLPGNEIADKAAVVLPDKSAFIMVYCRSGARSEDASNLLIKMGYSNVYDLGGIINWPYETVNE